MGYRVSRSGYGPWAIWWPLPMRNHHPSKLYTLSMNLLQAQLLRSQCPKQEKEQKPLPMLWSSLHCRPLVVFLNRNQSLVVFNNHNYPSLVEVRKNYSVVVYLHKLRRWCFPSTVVANWWMELSYWGNLTSPKLYQCLSQFGVPDGVRILVYGVEHCSVETK